MTKNKVAFKLGSNQGLARALDAACEGSVLVDAGRVGELAVVTLDEAVFKFCRIDSNSLSRFPDDT